MIYNAAISRYEEKEKIIGEKDFRQMERFFMLQTVDTLWKEHLLAMDHLKEGIGLRGYAQQNPLIVYKKEGFDMFNDMIARVKEETLKIMFRIQIVSAEKLDDMRENKAEELGFPPMVRSRRKKPRLKEAGIKSAATLPAHAAAGKNTKNAAVDNRLKTCAGGTLFKAAAQCGIIFRS